VAVQRVLPASETPCVLSGWSLGAILALQAALDSVSSRFSGMVLFSGTTRMTVAPGHAGTDPRALRAMRLKLQRDPQAVLRDFAALSLFPVEDAEATAEFVEQALPCGVDDLGKGLDALACVDLRESVRHLDLPVLVVHGSEDRVIPAQAGRELAEAIPGARWELLTGQGHALPWRPPSGLGTRVKEFLSCTA
jgi:pimeloyl-ACP methyl ester carboxylesterase